MFATTIAEYFVEKEGVALHLEIGVNDLDAFRNLMPDEVYEKLGRDPKPLAERLLTFYQQDLVIVPDNGNPLPGRIVSMGPEDRVTRDAITGEPLPAGDEEPEVVIRAWIEYRWDETNGAISIGRSWASNRSMGSGNSSNSRSSRNSASSRPLSGTSFQFPQTAGA